MDGGSEEAYLGRPRERLGGSLPGKRAVLGLVACVETCCACAAGKWVVVMRRKSGLGQMKLPRLDRQQPVVEGVVS